MRDEKGQSYVLELFQISDGIVIREVTLVTVINNHKSSVAMLHINPPIILLRITLELAGKTLN